MPFSNLDMKKAYYYVICVMAFFVLMWGVVDATSSSIGLYAIKNIPPALSSTSEGTPPAEKSDQFFDAYYQRKMLYDRLWDSLARVAISGIIFVYFRYNANKLEKQA